MYLKQLLLTLLCLPAFLQGECFTAQFRCGYFFPASHFFKEIFHENGIEVEGEAAMYLNQDWSVWMNFNSYQKGGHSLGLHDKVNVYVRPFSMGLKYEIPLTRDLALYLGGGATYTWITTHQHTPFIDRHVYKRSWGGVGKSGLIYHINDCFFLDLYADYYYTKFDTERGSQNLGGLRAGVGIGSSF